MSLPASRSSASFICRSCRALPSKSKTITSLLPRATSHPFSTTPSKSFSQSPIPKAAGNPFRRGSKFGRSKGQDTLNIPILQRLLERGFDLDQIPGYLFWQQCISNDIVADHSITATDLHQTALKYGKLIVRGGPDGALATDPQLTMKHDIQLPTLYYVQLCIMASFANATDVLRLFSVHIMNTLVSVHEYQPAVLSMARMRSWSHSKELTDRILKRMFKEGGDGRGFVDANAATLAGLQCFWEVEEMSRSGSGKRANEIVEPAHAVHPSKLKAVNAGGAAKGAAVSPQNISNTNRKKREGIQWFLRAIELNKSQAPGTWDWAASCYRSLAKLYDADSPKERPLKLAALEHLAVELDDMEGCFLYGMTLPEDSELRWKMIEKAATSGHKAAQREMEMVCVKKLANMDEQGATERDIKHLVILADEWGRLGQLPA